MMMTLAISQNLRCFSHCCLSRRGLQLHQDWSSHWVAAVEFPELRLLPRLVKNVRRARDVTTSLSFDPDTPVAVKRQNRESPTLVRSMYLRAYGYFNTGPQDKAHL
jgi:hypothetical protein